MRILSITAQKPHSTGSGTYLTELVRSWADSGHEQAVVCGIYPDDTVDFPAGVSCYPVFFTDTKAVSHSSGDLLFTQCKAKMKTPTINALPFPIAGMSDIMPYTSTRYRDMTMDMVASFEDAFIDAVRRAVEDLDPDLIICHHLFLLTALVRKHFPDRVIYGISHGSDLRQMDYSVTIPELVKPWISGLDRVLALNETQKERVEMLFGIEPERISVIGSGYNDKLFNTNGRAPRADIEHIADIAEMKLPVIISYAGKMSRSKGIPELLRALTALTEDPSIPYFEVTLAGGCQDDEIRKSLDDLPSSINWAGQISQAHLADIFKYSDIFVLPSYYEGLPLVLIEAMASGAVPVSTDLPGVRLWIEANVPHQNVRFIPMPEMASIDQPTDEGREQFVRDLTDTLGTLIREIADPSRPVPEKPDTSGINWHGVAKKITDLLQMSDH